MRVKTVSRLHMSLIDMHGGLGRVDGGVGLTLSEPSVIVEAENSDTLRVTGQHSECVEAAASSILERFGGEGVSIEVIEAFPRHVGLGSGTQLALAGATATLKILGESMSVPERAHVTGRGGTSGIGTAAFEDGGFVLDGGHALDKKGGFKPSRTADVPPPPILSRLEFPEWEIAIALPETKGVSGGDEQDIFDEVCPIPEEEVRAVARIVTMELLPAVANNEFKTFRAAINRLQEIGFKQREIQLQPEARSLVETFQQRGYAAGMSSFGPAVFAIHPDEVSVADIEHSTFFTKPDNKGAVIR
jgi:beta-ribofuranosylaminobenzene 5'-phosphate synthase